MKRIVYSLLFVAVAACSLFATRNDFGLMRNMEIMVNLFREISENYVDEVDPDKLVEYAADGISRRLDPYTQYLPEEEMSGFEQMTTGKYGGIGSVIRRRDEYVCIAQPYKGSPADKAGLIIGDKIVAIEGESTRNFDVSDVSSRLKGTPGTNINISVEKLLTGEVEDVTLRRERISIPGIPYYGFIGDRADSIGYIQHSEFSDGVADDMRRAIDSLRRAGMKSLVIDYRDNGGGILQEAVEVVSLFTPKGTKVVTTKGRKDSVVLRTTKEPILKDMPLALLISPNSASAAEIVSGALQDLDRAVLIGQRSFGKGLVQGTRPVGYNSYVKLTTAKYYIPSGRCIQALDYSDHSDSGRVVKVADSLKRKFFTKGGRVVYDGGGITPDVELKADYVSRFAVTLYAMGYIDEFGDEYFKRHHSDVVDYDTFSISDADYADFVEFMADKDVEYESTTRRVLKSLKEAAVQDLYSDIAAQIEELEANLQDDRESNLETYKDEIIRTINSDILMRHGYLEAVARHNLWDDDQVAEAVKVLRSSDRYNEILTAKSE